MAIDPKDDFDRMMRSCFFDKNGCLIWTKSIDKDGYGIFGTGSRINKTFKVSKVHRWHYEYINGPVQDGLELDHLCRVRKCININHLEPVSHLENIRRGRSANRDRDKCIRGHDLFGQNLYITPVGKRMCKKCGAARTAAYMKKTNNAAQKKWRENNKRRKPIAI